MNNSIFSIEVYKDNGMWVFDDDRVGLVKEPFVAGADTLLDILSDGFNNITIIFSLIEFPHNKVVIEQDNVLAPAGTNYICTEARVKKAIGHKLWLCPALNLYFPVSPLKIFIDYRL